MRNQHDQEVPNLEVGHALGCTISWADVSIDIPKHPRNNLYFVNTSLPQTKTNVSSQNEANLDVEIPSDHDAVINPDQLTQSQHKLFDLHLSLGHCSLQMLKSAVTNGHISSITRPRTHLHNYLQLNLLSMCMEIMAENTNPHGMENVDSHSILTK